MSKIDFNIYLDGRAIHVSEEVYNVYTRGKRKERYFMEDLKTERMKFNPETGTIQIIPSREDSYERLMANNHSFMVQVQSVEDKAVLSVLLQKALHSLSDEEKRLIYELFYLGKTERDLCVLFQLPKCTIHYRKKRALEKLKNAIEKKSKSSYPLTPRQRA